MTGTAGLTRPVPRRETARVRLGHGSGGQLTAELLADVVVGELGDCAPPEDAAVVHAGGRRVVVSTDSFVVTPRFFPGGDIGSLAVYGTVNDIAMRGARPVALALAYVLEEGLPLDELRAITRSVAWAAAEVGIPVVTGDTKVVDRGAADGMYVTTTGIGVRLPNADPAASHGLPGDVVLLSGPIAAHGTTILTTRGGLGFDTDIHSDSRPLHHLVAAMISAGGTGVHVLRDPTRGGLAGSLNALAQASGVAVEIIEAAVPVPPQVAATCELLGLDPLHVASEGCLVAFVHRTAADRVLTAMRSVPAGRDATVIGHVTDRPAGRVVAYTPAGSTRIISMLDGEKLPRVC